MTRLTKIDLQHILKVNPDGIFGSISKNALLKKLTNKKAPAITEAQFIEASERLKVPVKHMKGVRKVEAPRGAFDDDGRVTALYERHKFKNHTIPVGRYDKSQPLLSGGAYGPGGYGPYDSQLIKFIDACALDPHAAFCACSWGAFQVLGENWQDLKYKSVDEMVFSLVQSEAAHLETFVRYLEANNLVERFRACKPNDALSCEPFTSKYNGPNHKAFNYPTKLAKAIA